MRCYKTEIRLNLAQQYKYTKTIGTCRFVYNLFLAKNKDLYEQNKGTDKPKFINNYEFSKWLNNEYLPNNLDKQWIKEVSSKSVRHTIDNANTAFIKFFKGQSRFPRFKKKGKDECGMYFVRNNDTDCKCERHRIKIPTLGWVQFKEYGYLPTNKIITSGTITKKAGKYFISVLVDELCKFEKNNTNYGIGIDLGIKDFAILNDGTKYKTDKQKRLNKRLKREQRTLSKKYQQNKLKNKKEVATCKNIQKQLVKVQRLHLRIVNKRNDTHNKIITEIIKRKPNFITIEDLNVRGMMKNRHLSKAIANQGFNQFINKLKTKCNENSIELRQVDRFFPSSKLCSECGQIKKDLVLKDRVYRCECGNVIDRDVQAALNLKNARIYKIAN